MDGKETFWVLTESLGCPNRPLPAAATLDQVARLEQAIGYRLPPTLASMYLVHDGEVKAHGRTSPRLFFNREFLSLNEVLGNRDAYFGGLTSAEEDRGAASWPFRSVPPGYVRERYFMRGWIPFAGMYAPDHFAIDYVPGPEGMVGQIIHVDGDSDRRFVIAPDFDSFIEMTMRAYEQRRLHRRFRWVDGEIPDIIEWRQSFYGS